MTTLERQAYDLYIALRNRARDFRRAYGPGHIHTPENARLDRLVMLAHDRYARRAGITLYN
jgi:hypothetical protein